MTVARHTRMCSHFAVAMKAFQQQWNAIVSQGDTPRVVLTPDGFPKALNASEICRQWAVLADRFASLPPRLACWAWPLPLAFAPSFIRSLGGLAVSRPVSTSITIATRLVFMRKRLGSYPCLPVVARPRSSSANPGRDRQISAHAVAVDARHDDLGPRV